MYTGARTLWLRFFQCNLQCGGFGQKDPTNPDTYELPFEDFDVSTVNRLEDLPVWKFGCDSSYSWSKKFKHLNHTGTANSIALELMGLIIDENNPYGTFLHDKTGQETHMCFTGGEPLLKVNQSNIVSILKEFEQYPGGMMRDTNHRKSSNLPRYVTFETNGTQKLTKEFVDYFQQHSQYLRVLFSVSPKLFTVSGENNLKAIHPDTIASYQNTSSKGQLKFVLGKDERQWDEMEECLIKFRSSGVKYPVFIMPVGATLEAQDDIAGEVADIALARGYNVAARVHCNLWGNKIGK